MENQNKQKSNIIMIVSVAVLTVLVLGASYAYFAASIGDAAITNVNVTSKTIDNMAFDAGSRLLLTATQQNFYENAGNISATTTASANLVANNVAAVEYCYTVDLVVDSNTFVYTVGEGTPEILFSITKDGNSLMVDRNITNFVGTINIPNLLGGTDLIHKISAEASEEVTQSFVPNVTFVNLGTDQRANEEKSLSAVLQFTSVDCS